MMDDPFRSHESDATGTWIEALIKSEVRRQSAFLATVTFVDGHNVEITRSSSEGVPDGQLYASCPGFLLSVGDIVLCQPVGGEPIIIGRVANGEPAGEVIDTATLDITGDVTIDGSLAVNSGMDAGDVTTGTFLPTVLGTGMPQLGMYLEGNGAWSYPVIQEGPFVRPGIQLADLATATGPSAGQSIAHYLGQSIKPVTQAVLRTFVVTAYAAGTGGTPWAEVAIATSPLPTLNGNADLTLQGFASVTSTFNVTNTAVTTTISGMAIPAHSHIWLLWGSQGGTTGGVLFTLRSGLGAPATTGIDLFKTGTRPSTMAAPTTFAPFAGAANMAWWAAQLA